MGVWANGFFLSEWLFRLCGHRTCFTVDIDTFVPVSSSIFTRSFARTRLLPERYDGCVVPWCLYLCNIVCTNERGTFRHLKIAPKDEPDLWRSIIYFLLRSGWFLLIFPWCQTKRHWVWRKALKYIHRYTSNWLKLCQLAYQKRLNPWHTFLEFSKLFKGSQLSVYKLLTHWNCYTVNCL